MPSAAVLLLACGAALAQAHAPPPAGRHRDSLLPDRPLVLVQAGPGPTLPSLVLPPDASAEPPLFVSLMRMGDSAMIRGDILRARALYERAAAAHPASPAAPIAAGKTYDPNILPHFGGGSSFADVAKAREWYERARALGDPAAASLLSSLR